MKVPSRVAVVWFGLFVLGLGFGVVVTSNGLPWWMAPITSAVVLAGSVEFLLVGMLAAATPLAAIAATTFLVNSRHLFYGLTFPLHAVTGRIAKTYSVYALVDEAYVLVTTAPSGTMTGRRILLTQAGLHGSWVTGSLCGALAGGAFLKDVPGVDFVLTALFVVLVIDAYRADRDRVTAALAVGAAVIGVTLTPGAMLLVAMAAFAGLLMVRHYAGRRSATAVREKELADA
ncbi:AzlC family ABC transporter permease [Tsukamurella strandjordii]|uniref:AzlC family ABC transporter permease n=1 Tax=Tsukamurella strandjordii TaxID=147577 RepID=A0AA90NCL5_9ACTN|nr:AzlC family ABC transporter permease [Tsukamurella strandjordii]MDP0397932.1 AzlC family ABC transporter permease [Tsukamurella strandjordii]